MKCHTFITDKHDEEVLIYSKEKNSLVIEIERLVSSSNQSLVGKKEDEIIKINPLDVSCFIAENNKVYALIKKDKYQINLRIYQLEEILNDFYIKINQSCYANIKRIKNFTTTIGGTVNVNFDNGYIDYISRRELKNVKKRMGI